MWQQSLWNWIWTDKRVWSVITQGKKKNILDKWKKSCEIVTCQLHTDGKLDRSLSGGGDWRGKIGRDSNNISLQKNMNSW